MQRLLPRLLLLTLLGTPVVSAQPLPAPPSGSAEFGRLFMTPERRAALERQRQLNQQEAMAADSDAVAVNGLVRRSSGRSTVWVNQRPQHENSHAPQVALPSQSQPGSVNLQSDDQATQLKVGESINRGTQERSDVVTPGAIRVTPQRR